VNLKVGITEMYPWIPWEMATYPLGSPEHNFRTNALADTLNTTASLLYTTLEVLIAPLPSAVERNEIL
jgi:hypothetical protein